MKLAWRIILALALLAAAITAYSYGSITGVFLFVIIGFVLEGLFWFNLFPVRRRINH
ncbi:hypothetical protein [Alteromonas halophila]|uniref:Uncharacterized protein n=1 Tax=Alteromonas halophila TaxID=516698 RepID=A0A918JS81_9ALTE|nr:hypothetical protein [Alteromonas halophila]GGW98035.1 hypothetical protein GCM10007391_35040 [Alteromonas halophila]